MCLPSCYLDLGRHVGLPLLNRVQSFMSWFQLFDQAFLLNRLGSVPNKYLGRV